MKYKVVQNITIIFANTFFMKKLVAALLGIFSILFINAQTDAFPPVDQSPMDISYYPTNYPVLKIQDKITESLVARVVYSRPKKSGRVLFGGLVKYGDVWRMGANEATEIEFFRHVRIGGKKIPKGRYTLYAVVNDTSWTIIVNKETDTWGAFRYNPKKDIVRVDVPVQRINAIVEYLSMIFEKTGTGINLVVGWDNVKVELPITY
jgi:hypothetical protein